MKTNTQYLVNIGGGYIRHNEIRRKVSDHKNEIVADLSVCNNDALMMYEPFIEHTENDED